MIFILFLQTRSLISSTKLLFHGLVRLDRNKTSTSIIRLITNSYQLHVFLIGRGLLIANGKRWVRARRLLTPAFHFDVLRPYIKVYNEASRLLVSQWLSKSGEGESFDVYHSISLFTLDVMLRCACSFESNCQVSKY